jgi:putative addiction module component (TIGR02574 family)
MLSEELKKLTTSEKILLINDLWDDIAMSPEDVPISDEQKKVLEERYQEFLEDPEEGVTWNQAKQVIRKDLRNTA